MSGKNIKRLIVGILITFSIWYLMRMCVFPMCKILTQESEPTEKVLHRQNLAKKEYSSLFTKEVRLKMTAHIGFAPKIKFVFYSYYLDLGGNYMVDVYKVKIPQGVLFKDFITIEKSDRKRSNYTTYVGYEDTDIIKMSYSYDCDSTVESIFIGHDGDLPEKTNVGDSIINYNLHTSNLSIFYKKNGITDLFYANNQKTFFRKTISPINFNMSFIHKKTHVYIIIVYPREIGVVNNKSFYLNLIGIN